MNSKLYWLPNLFTSLTLVSGFYSITLALDGLLNAAVHAILAAMIFDFLDGWVARKTNTVSAFGKEYDSLCDMVAFGLAPAITVYGMLTWDSMLSWLVPAVYSCAVAMRLAKFNTSESKSTNFQGLPCTAGGPFLVLMCYLIQASVNPVSPIVIAITTLSVAVLMNSKVEYRSLKKNHKLLNKRRLSIISALVSLSVAYMPLNTIAMILLLYIVSPLLSVKAVFNHWKSRLAQNS